MVNSENAGLPDARDAAQAADLLVTVAETLNARLAVTAEELARSQAMLREASGELMTAFRGAARDGGLRARERGLSRDRGRGRRAGAGPRRRHRVRPRHHRPEHAEHGRAHAGAQPAPDGRLQERADPVADDRIVGCDEAA